jgi:hypothetical protein
MAGMWSCGLLHMPRRLAWPAVSKVSEKLMHLTYIKRSCFVAVAQVQEFQAL